MTISPKNFAEQLAVIRDMITPFSLPVLARGLRNGALPRRALVLTMDDGYADNLHLALPLLEKYEIPATVFVVSGYIGQEFWWDELVRLVFSEGAFADGLCLQIANQEFAWQREQAEENEQQQRCLLEKLYWLIRPLAEPERQKVMTQLRLYAHKAQSEELPHRALTVAELNSLATSPLIEIGSHTHTHRTLTTLTCAEQHDEIEYSQARLAELIGRTVGGFSFPYGSYSKEAQKIVREAAYGCACSSDQDTVQSMSQLYQLPRLWVPNVDGEAFGRWLKPWLPV